MSDHEPSDWAFESYNARIQASSLEQWAGEYLRKAREALREAAYHRAVERDHRLTPLESAHAGMALDEVRGSQPFDRPRTA